MKRRNLFTGILFCFMICFIVNIAQAAFVANETYTISLEAVKSNGQITSVATRDSIGVSSLAIADSNSKLSFSLSGVPNSSSYNFLVVTIKDSSGTVVRRSVVPAPAPGSALDFGISPLTEKQTQAFLQVFSDSATDDPLLAFFGFVMVRSPNVTTNDILTMANICNKGIKGNDGTGLTDGFEAKLRSEGVTVTQLANMRSNIVTNLSTFSSLNKDSIDQYFTSGSTAELTKRGEAAAKIFEILVDATADAGINTETLLYAFNAMGAIVLPLMDAGVAAGTLSPSIEAGLEATIGNGLNKLRADNFLRKYTDALVSLGATDAEIAAYNTAVNTLTTAMQAQFEEFEKAANKDGGADVADVNAQNTEMNTGMQTAFNTFMTDVAASDAQITDLRNILAIAFSITPGNLNTELPVSRFQFYAMGSSGSSTPVNWPIMMVVATRWMADIVIAGGSLTYTRDSTTPSANMWWLGYCGTNAHWDQATCAAAHSSQWTVARRDYSNMYPSGMLSWAILEMIREDIQILQFTRWDAFSSGDVASATDESSRMEAMETAEKNFYSKLFNAASATSLTSLIGGTLDGSTAIPVATRKALLTVFLDPDF